MFCYFKQVFSDQPSPILSRRPMASDHNSDFGKNTEEIGSVYYSLSTSPSNLAPADDILSSNNEMLLDKFNVSSLAMSKSMLTWNIIYFKPKGSSYPQTVVIMVYHGLIRWNLVLVAIRMFRILLVLITTHPLVQAIPPLKDKKVEHPFSRDVLVSWRKTSKLHQLSAIVTIPYNLNVLTLSF